MVYKFKEHELMMIEQIENFCLKHGLLKKGMTLLIACSGGADSLALTDVFRNLKDKYSLKLHIAHAEHGIRGNDSLLDAKCVENYCRKYDLPFHIEHLNVLPYSDSEKLSVETAARILRYRFLRKTAQCIHADKIATAHHLNDQAETVLQHLMRGAGAEGLSGIKPLSDDIIRPFLCVYRCEIEAYCHEHHLAYCIDKTNNSLEYERNRIRHELLPQMKTYNDNVVAAICRSAEIISQEHDFIDFCAQKLYATICEKNNITPTKIIVTSDKLMAEHIAVRKALYRFILKKLHGNLENIDFEHIDKIDKFLYNGRTGIVVQLPHDLRLTRQYDKIIFFQQTKAGNSESLAEYNIQVVSSRISLPDGKILEILPVQKPFFIQGRNCCFIDGDKIIGNLYVRNRRQGDRIIPKGMTGSKKLKNIFIDCKVPAIQRNNVPLLCDDNGILWIGGIQQAARTTISEHTQNILYLNLKN